MMSMGAKAVRKPSVLVAGASSPPPGRAGAGSTGPEAKPGSNPGASIPELPILFSGPMVLAILEGRKSQTRRVIKPQPHPGFLARGVVDVVAQWPNQDGVRWFMADGYSELVQCPYRPGNHCWVRETWFPDPPNDGTWAYTSWAGCRQSRLAEIPERFRTREWCLYRQTWRGYRISWRPSIFMPRWASRLTLEIVAVRVERLQDISEEDAKAEGVDYPAHGPQSCYRSAFRTLWDSLNAKRGFGWSVNPWVWVIEFKRVCS